MANSLAKMQSEALAKLRDLGYPRKTAEAISKTGKTAYDMSIGKLKPPAYGDPGSQGFLAKLAPDYDKAELLRAAGVSDDVIAAGGDIDAGQMDLLMSKYPEDRKEAEESIRASAPAAPAPTQTSRAPKTADRTRAGNQLTDVLRDLTEAKYGKQGADAMFGPGFDPTSDPSLPWRIGIADDLDISDYLEALGTSPEVAAKFEKASGAEGANIESLLDSATKGAGYGERPIEEQLDALIAQIDGPAPEQETPDLTQERIDRSQDLYGKQFREELTAGSDKAAGQIRGAYNTEADTLLGSKGYEGLQKNADEFRSVYDQGGLTDVTLAALEASRRDADQWVNQQQDARHQDWQERGVASASAEALSGMQMAGDAQNRRSQMDLSTNAEAQRQAFDALDRAGGYDRETLAADERAGGLRSTGELKATDLEFDTIDRLASTDFKIGEDKHRRELEAQDRMMSSAERRSDAATSQFTNAFEKGGNEVKSGAGLIPGTQAPSGVPAPTQAPNTGPTVDVSEPFNTPGSLGSARGGAISDANRDPSKTPQTPGLS